MRSIAFGANRSFIYRGQISAGNKSSAENGLRNMRLEEGERRNSIACANLVVRTPQVKAPREDNMDLPILLYHRFRPRPQIPSPDDEIWLKGLSWIQISVTEGLVLPRRTHPLNIRFQHNHFVTDAFLLIEMS
jgi:hypothetical protein